MFHLSNITCPSPSHLLFRLPLILGLGLLLACSKAAQKPKPPETSLSSRFEREGTLSNQALSSLQHLKWQIFNQMQEQAPQAKQSDPIRIQNYDYFSRLVPGDRHDQILRRLLAPNSAEELVFDPNRALAERSDFALLSFRPCPSQDRIALIFYDAGSNAKFAGWTTIGSDRVVILSGRDVDQIEWLNDNHTLIVVTRDGLRPARLEAWDTLSEAEPSLIFDETRQDRYLRIERSRSGKFITLSSSSLNQEEFFWLNADQPASKISRFDGGASAPKDSWLVESGDSLKLVKSEQVIQAGEALQQLESFKDFNLALITQPAAKVARLLNRDLALLTQWRFPPWSSLQFKPSYDFEAHSVELIYQDPLTPRELIEIPPRANQSQRLEISRVHGSLLSATSADGTQVPLAVLFASPERKPAPTVLTGYGAYGELLNTRYSPTIKALVDQGLNVALCFVRGGGEGGRAWYEAGRALNKAYSFEDFLGCAEKLYNSGVTPPGKLGALGRSAGGLLVAASMLKRPELFAAIVLDSPVLDVLAESSDPKSAHYQREIAEWGGPSAKEYIAKYSPLSNLSKREYPAVLITHSLTDELVPVEQSLRFIELLRSNNTGKAISILRTASNGSHTLKLDRYVELEESALKVAFLADKLR